MRSFGIIRGQNTNNLKNRQIIYQNDARGLVTTKNELRSQSRSPDQMPRAKRKDEKKRQVNRFPLEKREYKKRMTRQFVNESLLRPVVSP